MPPSRSHRFRGRTIAGMLLLAMLAMLAFPRVARADRVDRLIRQMIRNSDYKVRLSAALNLAKIGDRRAVPAFVVALRDKDSTVRGVAAAALGKLVDSDTKPAIRSRAVAALARTARYDKNSFVRRQAHRAYQELKNLSGRSGRARVYVHIGRMADKTRGRMRELMRQTTEKVFHSHARGMTTAWPGGRAPTKKQLRRSGAKGFHVDGTLTVLRAQPRGSQTLVSCKVSMLVATYPDKSMFGFLRGGARVQAGSSSSEVRYAEQDCVQAVVESLVAKKIIPTIEARAR